MFETAAIALLYFVTFRLDGGTYGEPDAAMGTEADAFERSKGFVIVNLFGDFHSLFRLTLSTCCHAARTRL